jgi:hypothetical protein
LVDVDVVAVILVAVDIGRLPEDGVCDWEPTRLRNEFCISCDLVVAFGNGTSANDVCLTDALIGDVILEFLKSF